MESVDLRAFLQNSVPVLPGVTIGNQQAAIDQFKAQNIGAINILQDPVAQIAQGDILELIPFLEFSPEGRANNFDAPGMIVTSSCDLDRKDNVVLCPCFPKEKTARLSGHNDIISNLNYQFFYTGIWTVDLSRPIALPRKLLLKRIKEGQIIRSHSLTQAGWYLFITKFSLLYFRTDDQDTMSSRQSGTTP